MKIDPSKDIEFEEGDLEDINAFRKRNRGKIKEINIIPSQSWIDNWGERSHYLYYQLIK